MKKRFISLVLALAMILSLSMSASAVTYTDGTWKVHHSYSSTYGEVTQSNCKSTVYASSAKSGATSKATYYYSENTSGGDTAYVYTSVLYLTNSGASNTIIAGKHMASGSTLSATRTIETGSTVTGTYTAQGATSVYYGISGTLAFK